MTSRRTKCLLSAAALALAFAIPANAQTRTVGRKGATSLSANFSISAQETSATEADVTEWTGNYQSYIEVGRFLTDNLVLTVGTLFAGDIGGQASVFTNVSGGLRLYFSPNAAVSPYVSGGGGFFVQTGGGTSSEAGTLFGAGGVEAAVRDNATVFFEGTFEQQFFEGGKQTSLRGAVGLRILF